MTTAASLLTQAILRLEVTPGSKLVLLDIAPRANRDGLVAVSPREVAERTHLTTRGVYKALDALAQADYVKDVSEPSAWAMSRTWVVYLDQILPPTSVERHLWAYDIRRSWWHAVGKYETGADEPGPRVCVQCQCPRTPDDFPRIDRGGRASACHDCVKALTATLQAQGAEGERELKRRHALRQAHGIELEEFDAMVKAQRGRCAMCSHRAGTRPDGWIALVVDHCHVTGAIRGLLCAACNARLGNMEHSPMHARAYAYLASSPSVRRGGAL